MATTAGTLHLAQQLVRLAESSSSESSGGINPWAVGGGVLAILLVTLIAVVAIGGGREHS